MRKEIVTNLLRWFLKTTLIFIAFIIIIMPFIPAFKEYVFDYPEKEFGTKEVVIIGLGVLIFTGGIFSNTIIDALKNFFNAKLKNNVPKI